MLLWNNWLSLVCYIVIGIVVYFLSALSIVSQSLLWNLVVLIPILIATPILFILVGRYALKSQGSNIKDLTSVLLVCILGILITPHIAYFKPHHGASLSIGALYFLYATPLGELIMSFGKNLNGGNAFGIREVLPRIILGVIFSIIPTLLMWIGLRWRSRKHRFQ